LKMARRIFVDTKWNPKKNNNSKHVSYDPDKDVFFEVDSLAELKEYDEIYLDSSIFPNMWKQLREVISNGKSVYYFTKPWKWRQIRQRFREDLKIKTGRVSKTDKGDAFLLWKVYELSLIKNNTHRYFKPLTIIDIELRQLLMRENMLYKTSKELEIPAYSVLMLRAVEILEKRLKDVRREIVDRAIKLIPRFTDIAKNLGLDSDDINGLTGLAGELVYNRSTSYSSSVRFHGLFKANAHNARRMKRYSSKAQRYLLMLTNAILRKNSELHLPRYKDMRRVLRMVTEARKQIGLAGDGAGA